MMEAAELLEQLLLQDIEELSGGGASIKKGTTKGRVPSVTDPQHRRERKSARKRFISAKASIVADPWTGLILALDVLPGDSGDAVGALDLALQVEANIGAAITEVLADCAYGGGATRPEFADAGRELFAKVPSATRRRSFPKKSLPDRVAG